MKICMFSIGDIYGKQTGGIKRFKELYFYLKKAGHDVKLYCATDIEILKKNGITEAESVKTDGRYKGFLRIPSYVIYKNNQEIYKKISNEKYDCVISFDVPSTIGLCLKGIPNIYYFVRQDLIQYRKIQYENMNMKPLKKNILLIAGWIMEGICVRKSYKIVSQCKYDLNQIKIRHIFCKWMIKKKSIIQINNINPSWIKKCVNTIDRSQCSFDVIFVGNFDDSRKGYQLFIDAVQLLKERGTKLKIVMLGGGKYLDVCIQKYRDILFTGFVNNVGDYISQSRLMVVPSYADSCPNTIMEALQVGIPVIGADSSGIPEILTNAEWRFALTPESLADIIQNILKSENYAACMNEQRKRADELTFDWGQAIENILCEQRLVY